jgi:hypothetical protein
MFCEENVNKFSRGDGLQVFLLFYLKKMPEMFENLMKHPDEYMKVIYHWEDKE